MKFLWTWFLVFLGLFQQIYSQNKLNVPRVLLPRATDVVTNFQLKVSDGLGCFRWSSSRPEVVSVTTNPDESRPDGCSTSAVVAAVSRSKDRVTSMVWAEHETDRFRADVIVDSIRSLEIITTTQKFFLEDNPEVLEVRAKDAEGDTFTSLEGLEFEWRIENDKRNDSLFLDAHNILRIIKFSDTQYETPASISVMENRGLRGYVVLVEGLQTGSAIVTVSLKNPDFRDVESTSVRLRVVANLILKPPQDVFILPHGSIQYHVQQIKQARSFDVTMPSEQYYLEVEPKAGCLLDKRTSRVTCSEIGNAKVILKDRHMDEADANHPSASIHVVQPAFLILTILPGRNWILQRGSHYEIMAELYDRESHFIHSSSNLEIKVEFPAEYFGTVATSNNGSYNYVKAKQNGKTTIRAELLGVRTTDGRLVKFPSVTSKDQVIEIHDPVVVSPKRVMFPLDSASSKSYFLTISGKGGSGNYTWSSSNSLISTVDRNSGQIKSGIKEGSANITAFDVKNLLHTDKAEVYIVPVEDLVVVPEMLEVPVNGILLLPVALLGRIPGTDQLHVFSDCRFSELTAVVIDERLLTVKTDAPKAIRPEACTSFSFQALKAGNTEVVVSHTDSFGIIHVGNVTICVYNPLKLLDPTGISLLTIGSSQTFAFEGGPAPWIFEPSSHRVKLADLQHNTVNSRIFGGGESSIFVKVYCIKLGEEDLTIQVGNLPTKTNHHPAVAKATFSVICGQPHSMAVQVSVPKRFMDDRSGLQIPPCPWKPDLGEPFPVLRENDLLLDVSVFDSNGREFYNFSSLEFKWEVSNSGLLDLKESGLRFYWHRDKLSGKKGNQKTIFVRDSDGRSVITASVTGYRKESLEKISKGQTHSAKLDYSLKSSVEVKAVQEPHFEQKSVVIFNHPSNRESVSIRQGSGFFLVLESSTELAKISYDWKTRLLEISPRRDGDLTVMAYDLCTAASQTELQIQISGLNRIDVIVGDKVEIGQTIPLLVRVYDSAKSLLPTKFYSLISLSPVASSSIISLNADIRTSSFEQRYSVHGTVLGRTTLTFKGIRGDQVEVTSKAVEIQVFPPLRLEPQNVTLVETATFQLTAEGGPTPQVAVLFVAEKSTIAAVDASSGLIEANRIGNTVIVAQIIGVDPVTAKEVIYSKDQAQIHVVHLTGIKIQAPLRSLEVGSELPLIAFGISDHETPYAFGSALNPFQFHWTVDNIETGELNAPLPPFKLYSNPENGFAVRLTALYKGTIRVKLSVTGGKLTQNLTDQVLIRAVNPLKLIGFSGCENCVIVTPNTQTYLKSTRDNEAKISYSVIDGEDLINVDIQGQLTSESKVGSVAVQIRAVENDFTQTLLCQIQVKEPSYLKINLLNEMQTDDSIVALPLGVPFRFSVSLHDELGIRFYAVDSLLKYRTNRNDLLSVGWNAGKDLFTVKAANSGQTILKIWDADRPHLADYVNIRVAPVIEPHSYQARIGELICFTCPLRSSDGYSGRWSSSSFLVHINQDSGAALAVAAGSATIFYNISADVAPKTDVVVQNIQKISIIPRQERFLSNVANKEPVKIDVSLGKSWSTCSGQHKENLAILARQLWDFEKDLFKCSVEFDRVHPAGIIAADIFAVHSDIDDQTGQFQCVITTRVSALHLEEPLSRFESSVMLTVRAARGTQAPEVLPIEFLPAFYISTPEVHLNHVQLESIILISAASAVQQTLQLKPSDSGLFEVGRASPGKGTYQLQYPVRLQLSPTLNQRLQGATPELQITSLKTDQRISVPVKIRYLGDVSKLGGSLTGTSFDLSSLILPTLVVGGVIALVWVIYYFYQQAVQDRQYYQYLAATGHVPPQFNSGSPQQQRSSLNVTPLPLRSFADSSSGVAWKDDDSSFTGTPKLFSTNRSLATSGPGGTLFRRSPNAGL